MSELKLVDDRNVLDEDSYETDPKLIQRLQIHYNLKFELDAAARPHNKKYNEYLDNALFQEWITSTGKTVDVWCNPPHSLNEEFIKRADTQHKKWNINICMILPANCQSMPTWHNLIESELEVFTENHPIFKRPRFFKDGKRTKHNSRNAYHVIIWRHSSHE